MDKPEENFKEHSSSLQSEISFDSKKLACLTTESIFCRKREGHSTTLVCSHKLGTKNEKFRLKYDEVSAAKASLK